MRIEFQFDKMKRVLHKVGGNDSKQYESTSCHYPLTSTGLRWCVLWYVCSTMTFNNTLVSCSC